jgi:hypothetical protein
MQYLSAPEATDSLFLAALACIEIVANKMAATNE